MKILKQIGILFGLCWVSIYIESLLPFAFPASVIALVTLLALLLLRVIRVGHIREKSDFLLGNLPFFFIPAAVGIMEYKDVLLENGGAFFVICLMSMVVTFAVTAWVVQLAMGLIDKKGASK